MDLVLTRVGEGVKNPKNLTDAIYVRPLTSLRRFKLHMLSSPERSRSLRGPKFCELDY